MGTNKSCFIGLPIYQDVDPQFFLSCLKLIQGIRDNALVGALKPWLGDSAVSRARNALTKAFLDSDHTHLLFIDSDLVFSLEQVQRIMSHEEDVVGGLYCKKQEGKPELVLNSCVEPNETRTDGLHEVRYIGTGFLRVARSVFERMIEAWSDKLWYKSDRDGKIEYDFWGMGPYRYPDGNQRWLSEDWMFCQRCLDLGIKVWADMHILCRHSGSATYPLSYQEPILYGHELCPVDAGANTRAAGADIKSPPPVSAASS